MIMQFVLPPKRWQPAEDPKYDPIRPKRWFPRLLVRKNKLHNLEAARLKWRSYQKFVKDAQKRAAEEWGVDERELRDYCKFVEGYSKLLEEGPKYRQLAQILIDEAYNLYCHDKGLHSFQFWLKRVGDRSTIGGRQLIELWEVDPTFYPKGYK
jgi:hypothetical protein